jgi:hypothetical protein
VCEFWGAHLLPIYVRFTCDKLVSSFMPRYVAMIHRTKRLGETGAQQVLLDLQALKGCLLELPRACNATSTSAYTKMVSAEVGKAEQLLRLVLTPEDALTVRRGPRALAGGASRAAHGARTGRACAWALLERRPSLTALPCALRNAATPSPPSPQEHFAELAAGLVGAGGVGLDLARVLELKGVRRPDATTSAISLLEELKGGVSSHAANASISQSSQKIKKLLNIN